MTAAVTPAVAAASPAKAAPKHSGYAENVFAGKEQQKSAVVAFIAEKGFLPKELVESEVQWFYGNLGIDDKYFALESVESIANHIMALYGAKITAFTKRESQLDIHLTHETDNEAVFIHTSRPGVSVSAGPQIERHIDAKYLDVSSADKAFRLETYRSLGTVSTQSATQLRCYFVTKCDFVTANPTEEQAKDIRLVSDKAFLEKASEHTLSVYEPLMRGALERTGPVLEVLDVEGSREKRLIIAYRQQSTRTFFSAMSDLYHYYDLFSTRKYVEHFSNGVTIISLYLNPVPTPKPNAAPIEQSIYAVMKEASLIYCLPTTPLQHFFQEGRLSVQETIYGYVGWIFAQHFLNRLGSEYATLKGLLSETNPAHVEVLAKMKKRLRSDTFTREYILDIIRQYPDLVKALYTNFAMTHYVGQQQEAAIRPSLSYARIRTEQPLTDQQVLDKIRKTVSNGHERMVFEAFLTFNQHCLKTNFYQPTKVALSFRLDPSFLPDIEYPLKPYGLFIVVGAEFRGFHVRFRDIARGGIRVIRSRNAEAYSINLRSLFDENYNLANTQQRKNKDIPEGGSKGTILLDLAAGDKSRVAFTKYVDSILDLLIPGNTPGIKEAIVDRHGQPEVLFFGPDEGTADFMDWASQHSRRRGYAYWKAFTTGKSQSLGGIPHDTYGMTTRSVHQYVVGTLAKLNIDERTVRKMQTGGPDGDLGSNEIKISCDKTCGIVDGSGIIYDPEGLNRDELTRLANARQMIQHFDASKLSAKGFRVLIDETDVTLPDGTVVPNGLSFRNEFHLSSYALSNELFVPCGGRPEAVDISNVHHLLNEDGSSKLKYIVEGANLFFTQEARLRLEKAGAIVFKDASANKGGVTSSSLEVLAALSFTDAEFAEHMSVKNPAQVPLFYQQYVQEVQEIIERNAALEFECMWREHQATKTPYSVISDTLSFAIVKLNEELQRTNLWDNVALRRAVLADALPKTLQAKLGLDTVLARVPESYLRAIFGANLASRYVYKYGTQPSQFAFFEYLSPKLAQANASA